MPQEEQNRLVELREEPQWSQYMTHSSPLDTLCMSQRFQTHHQLRHFEETAPGYSAQGTALFRSEAAPKPSLQPAKPLGHSFAFHSPTGWEWPSRANWAIGSAAPRKRKPLTFLKPRARQIDRSESVRKVHDAAVEKAGIKDHFRLYDFRHTFATGSVAAGVDLPLSGDIGSHKHSDDDSLCTSSRGTEAFCSGQARDISAGGNLAGHRKKRAGRYN